MLQVLELKNFQTHKHFKLEFGPRVTVIVGPTDAGKSSIIRALRWVCLNDLKGKRFIKWGKSWAAVKLIVDGHTIIRGRSTDNIYKVNGKTLRNFKTGVAPVEQIVNVDENNFQRQIDGPYWFALPSPEISRRLNRIINLDSIDRAMGNAGKDLKRIHAEIRVTKDRIKEARENYRSTKWAVGFAAKIDRLEKLEKRHGAICDKIVALGPLLAQAAELGQSVKSASETIVAQRFALRIAGRRLKMIDALRNKLDEIKRREGTLGGLCLFAAQLRSEICQHQGSIEEMKKNITTELRGRCPTCGKELKKTERNLLLSSSVIST